MASKTLNTRIFLKNGTESDWEQVENFVPLKGEMIIYNEDANHSKPRVKVGNGIDIPRDLPFIDAGIDTENLVAKRVEHKLTFGNGGVYQYDGSADVTVPVYTGNMNLN